MSTPGLSVSPDGVAWPLRIDAGPEAVQSRVVTCLGTQLGEWPDDIEFGLPIEDWTSRSVVPLVEVQAVVRVQVAQVAGVVDVLAVEATRVAGRIAVAVRYTCRGLDDELVEAVARSWPDYGATLAYAGGAMLSPAVASGQGA